MTHKCVVMLCTILLAASAAAIEGSLDSCFEPLDQKTLGPYCAEVRTVVPGSPAASAGLEAGDQIVGLDGRRIRSRFDYGTYLRVNKDRRDVTVTVRRTGQYHTLPIQGIPDDRRTGCTLVDKPTGNHVWEVLELRWGIVPRDYLDRPLPGSDRKTRDEVIEMFSLAQIKPTLAYSDPTLVQLTYLPTRASENLWTLGEDLTKEKRDWVIGFLKVFCALTEERYTDAELVASQQKLREMTLDPFLSALLDFYLSVARMPPGGKNAIPLDAYGASPEFFASCFPFPVVPERRTDWSDPDPNYNKWLNLHTLGRDDINEVHAGGAMYTYNQRNPYGNDAEKYRYYVKAASLAVYTSTAWPHRSPELFSEVASRELVAAMKEYDRKHPEGKVVTAYAMLCPAYKAGDLEAFAAALDTIYKAGTREVAIANRLLANMASTWTGYTRSKHYAVQMAMEKKLNVPEIYSLLKQHSPSLKARAVDGYFCRYEFTVQDLGRWCKENPKAVIDAIDSMSRTPE